MSMKIYFKACVVNIPNFPGGTPITETTGCSSEILKRSHMSTKILFCGRGLINLFHP